jgi:hypothetical protein
MQEVLRRPCRCRRRKGPSVLRTERPCGRIVLASSHYELSRAAIPTPEEMMRAVHESQPFAQRNTARRSSWRRRIADLTAAFALIVAVTPTAIAQPVEIAYNTFLDPNNASDPRAAAQTKMIAEFERQNPNIKVRVVVDPTGANGARTLRTHADSADVVRASTSPRARCCSSTTWSNATKSIRTTGSFRYRLAWLAGACSGSSRTTASPS